MKGFKFQDFKLQWIVLFFVPCFLFAQEENKDVEILNADLLKFTEINGKKFTKLIGNVQLKQDEVFMFCDSALLDKDSNTLIAWHHIHIQQDSTHAYSTFLTYNGNTKLATLTNGVKLTDNKASIYTEELFYNSREKMAYYLAGGRVLREKSVIRSRMAYYYSTSGDVYFNKNVDIKDPEYRLTSDTLKYNLNTDFTTFYGNTTIYNQESRIECDNGWFDTKQDVASFGLNTTIYNGQQVLNSDSLYYDRRIKYGKAMNRFVWIDSSMAFELHGRRGDYYEVGKQIYAFDHAFAIYKMDNDSLFLRGDTLFSKEHSEIDTSKDFSAFHHVRFYMRNMQGVCDSFFYSTADSLFRFYYNPVLWADSTQMTGDSIHLRIKNKKADFLTLFEKSIIISPETKYYNQIQGKNIFGYFNDNELEKMFVDANAESIYYGKDDKGKYIGMNKATCVKMWMYFKEKKVNKVVFIEKPEAVFTPLKMISEEEKYLKLFTWQIDRKPTSREDIYLK